MRATLEQLKAMSDEELGRHWVNSRFPFEMLPCGNCLTMHDAFIPSRRCSVHPFLRPPTSGWLKDGDEAIGGGLRPNLEQLYALRLFHDALYPQTVEAAEEKTITESAPSLVAQG